MIKPVLFILIFKPILNFFNSIYNFTTEEVNNYKHKTKSPRINNEVNSVRRELDKKLALRNIKSRSKFIEYYKSKEFYEKSLIYKLWVQYLEYLHLWYLEDRD